MPLRICNILTEATHEQVIIIKYEKFINRHVMGKPNNDSQPRLGRQESRFESQFRQSLMGLEL